MKTALSLFHQASVPNRTAETYPVLFLLHGMGGNETNLLPVFEAFRDTHLIITIRGHLPHGNGYAYFYPKSYGNPDRATFDPAVTALAEFMEEALRQYPADPDRVFIAGFSQGAILGMTLSVATRLPIKGVVALNGYIPKFILEHAPERVATQYFVSQGKNDPIFPVTVGRETEAVLTPRAEQVTYVEYPAGHEITPAMVADVTRWLQERC